MSETETLTATTWFRATQYRRHVKEPSMSAIRLMLGEIEATLRARQLIPLALDCSVFADGDERTACIAIIAGPGEMIRPLTSWFQWMHPRWRWADCTPLLADPATRARDVEAAPC